MAPASGPPAGPAAPSAAPAAPALPGLLLRRALALLCHVLSIEKVHDWLARGKRSPICADGRRHVRCLAAGSGSVTGLVVHQPGAGVPAVDEAEVGGGLVEAEEFLEALREPADFRMAGAEGVRLAGTQPGLNVIDDNPKPRAPGGVGAGAWERRPPRSRTDPAGISAGIVSAGSGLPAGRRWLPGTMRVAPLSAVKSSSAHRAVTMTSRSRGSG